MFLLIAVVFIVRLAVVIVDFLTVIAVVAVVAVVVVAVAVDVVDAADETFFCAGKNCSTTTNNIVSKNKNKNFVHYVVS